MGILPCEQNFRNVWIWNKSVRAEIGQSLHTHTHAAKLAVRMYVYSQCATLTHPQSAERSLFSVSLWCTNCIVLFRMAWFVFRILCGIFCRTPDRKDLHCFSNVMYKTQTKWGEQMCTTFETAGIEPVTLNIYGLIYSSLQWLSCLSVCLSPSATQVRSGRGQRMTERPSSLAFLSTPSREWTIEQKGYILKHLFI